MDFWRRRERSRRQREQLFDFGIKLGRSREQAVISVSWLGCNPLGDLALHHDYNGFEIVVVAEQVQQYVGGNVVRQVSNDVRLRQGFIGLGLRSLVEQRPWLAPDHIRKIYLSTFPSMTSTLFC